MNRLAVFCGILLGVAIMIGAGSCEKESQGSDFVVQLSIPAEVNITNLDESITFRVMFNTPPLKTDLIQLLTPVGEIVDCNILTVSEKSVTFSIPKGLPSGEYKIYVVRDSFKKILGTFNLKVNYNSEVDVEIELLPDNNVYGIVSCGTEGVPGVVVSDGKRVVVTDEKGVYQFKSDKSVGYVFISVPSGYHVSTEGVFPQIYRLFTKSTSEVERFDFPLTKVEGQENHTMLVFGDMHLAARTSDASQFTAFVSDVNNLVKKQPNKTYAMTMGDMTWELYWESNKYGFQEYIEDINRLRDVIVFNTIGNHDHDMAFAGDFDTVTKYKKMIAPTYYSFNIGKVHYIVLDDIDCKNTGANTSNSRDYVAQVVSAQIEWLKKDLAYVSKDTPLFITMHAPVYNDSGNANLKNTTDLESAVSGYTNVHFWTGHTHKMYNIDKLSSKKIFEHNAGAVCATWWWTGHLTSGIHVAQDGAPGGYSVVNVSGTSCEWQFKPTGKDISHQFRTYDRNNITLTSSKYVSSSASAENKKKFDDAVGSWAISNNENYVYLNIWNYDPTWKIEIKEGDKKLEVEQVADKDPLHLIAYNGKNPSGGFGTSVTKHLFRVKASSANSTLNIKVVDRFGNEYTESMTRPKEFSLANYK